MTKLFRFLKPYTFHILGTIIFLFLQALGNLFLPFFLSKIIDVGITQGDKTYIYQIGVLMIVIAILASLSGVAAMFTSAKASMGFGKDLRSTIFTRVSSFSLGEFNTLGTSSLITRTTNDVYQVQQLIVMGLRMLVTAPLMAIGGFIMAISKNARLSLILLVSIPALFVVVFLVSQKTMPLYNLIQSKLDKVNLILRENLTGMRVIRAFDKTNYETKRFQEANKDLTDNAIKVNKLIAILMPLIMLVLNLTSVFILWFGSGQVLNGLMEVGDLIAFIQYVMQIMFALVMVTMIFVLIPRAMTSAKRILEVLDLPLQIQDPNHATNTFSKDSTIEFKDVSFTYPGAEHPTLQHISFITRPGEMTAIIGGTGSGKSTLLNLIVRFYDVTSGEILVDGVNIKSLSQQLLREKISYVPQKSMLFNGTITDNLLYGKNDASKEDIAHVLDIAQASDFVLEMPKGILAPISQGGTNLSGGQKQRLSIARALIKKAEVYLFDDSFSALDFKTDAKLRAALKKEMTQSAVIIVGQRISSIMSADTILVLDEGKLVGKGTHQELLKTCPTYIEIATSQLSKEELENV